MRRLYLQIYLTAVAILILFGVLMAFTWWLTGGQSERQQVFVGLAAVAVDVLPAMDRPVEEYQGKLEMLAESFSVELAVFAADGRRLAATNPDLPAPEPDRDESGWLRGHRRGWTAAIHLDDGRWLVIRHPPRKHTGPLVAILVLAFASAIGAYPLVRRLTGRLERLRDRVNRLGAGDLSARVQVEGKDEIADLATSFNRAAGRIEQLVEAQRHVLAGASHELRSPLTRMRVACELMDGGNVGEVRRRLIRDIERLDDLVEELLTTSRLEAGGELQRRERVDLLALAAEEAAAHGVEVSGEGVSIVGDPHLLRRLLRNLLDNARRYAAGTLIEVIVARSPSGATIQVMDRGPGVPTEERERIFEPFYRQPGHGESSHGGVGLGLALVRRIAHYHGGEVRCLARPGGGTSFEVELAQDSTGSNRP